MRRIAKLTSLWLWLFSTTSRADVHILLYGDAGRGSSAQRNVAEGMVGVDDTHRFDIALSLGDNQYIGTGSEVMDRIFEIPYKELIQRGLVFYQTIGNHDMEFNRLKSQLQYSVDQAVLARHKGGWALPSEDYVIKNHSVRFIVTNTAAHDGSVHMPASRQSWIETQLCNAKEKWVFLVMHYPFWSSNSHGDNPELIRRLSPVLDRCKPDALLAGHDHGAEVIKTPLGLQQFVIGNAAEATMPGGKTAGESLWRYGKIGFAGLEISDKAASIKFYRKDGSVVHNTAWSPVRSRTGID